MAISAAAVAYCVTGGLVLYSGIRGATIAHTVQYALRGNLGGLPDDEPVDFSSSSSSGGSAVSGSAILSDAEQYDGHRYVYGGPSNPQAGWDCSSFASYVLGHDLGMQLPGGQSWASATSNGQSHGPTADQFASTPGFTKAGTDPTQNQAGDLLVWTGHVGFGTGTGQMFSAFDEQSGTGQTAAQAPYSYLGTFRVQSTAAPSASGSYTVSSLQQLWTSAGGDSKTASIAAQVAMAESSGNPKATSSNPDGGQNVGLWQLDTKGVGAGYTVAQLENPTQNAQITIMHTKNGTDWSQWSDAVVSNLPGGQYSISTSYTSPNGYAYLWPGR